MKYPIYQHKRSYFQGTNGEGQPLPGQISEGEIAINLTTRQLYTSRYSQFKDSDADLVTVIDSDYGYYITVFEVYNDQVDSEVKVDDIVVYVDSDNNFDESMQAAGWTKPNNDREFYRQKPNATYVPNFDSEFYKHVDFGLEKLYSVTITTNPGYVQDQQVAITYMSGTQRFVAATAKVVAVNGANIILRSFHGSLDAASGTNFDIRRVTYDSEEIIRLNNIPYFSQTPPTHMRANGDMWVKANAPDQGIMHWLDLTLLNDSDAQVKAAASSNPLIVQIDNNGLHSTWPNRYGEWRPVNSPSILNQNIATTYTGTNVFDSDSTLIVHGETNFTNVVTFDSEVNFNSQVTNFTDGTINLDNTDIILDANSNLTIEQGGTFTFFDETGGALRAFDRTRKFTINDVGGTQVFSFWGLDNDADLTN